jgi:hypothetical protein
LALVSFNREPTSMQLRQFGVIGCLVFGLLGASVHWRGTLFGFDVGEAVPTVTVGFGAAAAAFALAAALAPKSLKWAFIALSVIALPIGFVLSYVLLGGLFFLLFTPIGLVMRVIGWDPMKRAWEPDSQSYWTRRAPTPGASRYFNQY